MLVFFFFFLYSMEVQIIVVVNCKKLIRAEQLTFFLMGNINMQTARYGGKWLP